jgi:hypothetical protein
MVLWTLMMAWVTAAQSGVAAAAGTGHRSSWNGPALHSWPILTVVAAAVLCAALLPRRVRG